MITATEWRPCLSSLALSLAPCSISQDAPARGMDPMPVNLIYEPGGREFPQTFYALLRRGYPDGTSADPPPEVCTITDLTFGSSGIITVIDFTCGGHRHSTLSARSGLCWPRGPTRRSCWRSGPSRQCMSMPGSSESHEVSAHLSSPPCGLHRERSWYLAQSWSVHLRSQWLHATSAKRMCRWCQSRRATNARGHTFSFSKAL